MWNPNESYERDLAAIQHSFPRLFREDQTVSYSSYGIWFAQELDQVKTQIYERMLPAINADLLVPDDTTTPDWKETITVRAFSNVGMAKVISNYADDLPRADVAFAEQTVIVKTIGDSFGYSVNELRASRASGAGLDTRKAEAARRAIELKVADVKLRGDPPFNLFGLFTHPNVPAMAFPNPGPWAGLTGNQIYQNLVEMAASYSRQTLGVHSANFLALAPDAYWAASTQFVTTAPGLPITARGLFQQQFPAITVREIWECAGAENGQDIALLYEKTGQNLAHMAVMPFVMLAPEARNLEIVTDCLARTGGVQIWYPLSLLKGMTS